MMVLLTECYRTRIGAAPPKQRAGPAHGNVMEDAPVAGFQRPNHSLGGLFAGGGPNGPAASAHRARAAQSADVLKPCC